MFKRKKTLDNISLSEMKMLDAQLECSIQSIMQEIKDADKKIDSCLLKSKKTMEEYEQKSIAREITSLVNQQRDLLQRLETVETKRRTLLHLISIKETESPLFTEKRDLLDKLDMDSVAELAEEAAIEKDVQNTRAKEMLKKLEDNDDYAKILSVVQSTALNGEDVVCAKAEIEDIAFKQRLYREES